MSPCLSPVPCSWSVTKDMHRTGKALKSFLPRDSEERIMVVVSIVEQKMGMCESVETLK